MKKRLVLIISIVLFIVLLIFIAFNIKKSKLSLKIGQSDTASITSLLSKAGELQAKGALTGAKSIYEKLIAEFPNSSEVMNWQKRAEGLNIKLIFSPIATAKSAVYIIKPGDTLTNIAREFKTTVDLIKKSNNFTDDKILPGKRIKVWTAPFSIVVDKSENMLMLKSDEEVIKTYTVATGVNNSTPAGNFKINSKLKNPTWFKAGAVVAPGSPENILGTRWLGLNLAGYGIHGTTEPQSLGKQVTQGCVRMANSEAEELYTIVPEGTEVTIID